MFKRIGESKSSQGEAAEKAASLMHRDQNQAIDFFRINMNPQTISLRLPDKESSMADAISERKCCFKTPIIREAPQPVSRSDLDESETIEISNTQFQALLDEIALPPDEEVKSRRRHLMSYELWK